MNAVRPPKNEMASIRDAQPRTSITCANPSLRIRVSAARKTLAPTAKRPIAAAMRKGLMSDEISIRRACRRRPARLYPLRPPLTERRSTIGIGRELTRFVNQPRTTSTYVSCVETEQAARTTLPRSIRKLENARTTGLPASQLIPVLNTRDEMFRNADRWTALSAAP